MIIHTHQKFEEMYKTARLSNLRFSRNTRTGLLGSVTRALLPSRAGIVLVILGLLLGFFVTPVQNTVAVSNEINFQARLLNADGSLVDDGDYNVEFKLYDSAGSGASVQGTCVGDPTDDCEWMETRTGGNVVTVKNGYLYANLGSVTAFSGVDWSKDLWLTFNIGGTGSPSWDGEMSPRMKLTAIPYAFSTDTIDGLDSTDFVQINQGEQAVNSAGTGDAAVISIDQAGAGDLVNLQVSNSTVFNINNSGNVTMSGDLAVNGGDATLGVASTTSGTLQFFDSNSTYSVTLQAPDMSLESSSVTFTLPSADGLNNQCIATDGSGNLGFIGCGGTVELQSAYNNSAGGTTPEIKLDSTRAAIDIQDADTTIAGALLNVRASNGAGLGALLFSVESDGDVIIGSDNNQGFVKLSDGDATSNIGIIQVTDLTNDRTYTFPDESGEICLSTGNCSGAGTTLQTSYDNSTGGTTPEIKLDSTRNALDIQDADTTIGADLLTVRASNGAGLGDLLFSVDNSGVQIGNGDNADIDLLIAKEETATVGTQYSSNDITLQSSVWDTTNTQAEDRNISLRNIAGSGADGSEPYRLAVVDNAGTEFISFDGLNGRLGINNTSPSYALDLVSAENVGARFVNSGGVSVTLADSTSGNYALRTNYPITVSDVYVPADGGLISNSGNLSFSPNQSVAATLTAGGNFGIGTATPNGILTVQGDRTANVWGTSGIVTRVVAGTYTDQSTAASGTATSAVFNSFATPTLAATNSSVTTTSAATVYIQSAPTAGTNQTITNAYALWIDAGNSRFDGNIGINTEPTANPLVVSRASGQGNGEVLRLLPETGSGSIFYAGTASLGLYSTAGEASSGQNISFGIGEATPDTNLQVKENSTDTVPTAEFEQLGTGDSALQFSITGAAYAIGVDNSDGDSFKLSYAAAEGTAVLGTNDYLTITTGGDTTLGGALTVTNDLTVDTNTLYVDSTNNFVGVGTASPSAKLTVAGDITANNWGLNGIQLQSASATFTDDDTAASGTATNAVFNSFAQPTLAATNASVTTTNASTVYIADAPVAGTNQTITNAYALWVDAGTTRLDGALEVIGTSSFTADATFTGDIAVNGGNITSTGALSIDVTDTNNFTVTDGTNTLLTVADGGTVGNVTATGTLAVQGASVTIGGDSVAGSIVISDGAGTAEYGTISLATLGQATAYTIPDPGGATGTICLVETGNCAGAGGGVTTAGGTTNAIPVFTGAQTLGDSSLTDDGSDVTVADGVNVTVDTNTLYVDATNDTVGIGTTSPDGKLEIAGNLTANAWGANGIALQVSGATYTDDSTAASGTASIAAINSFGQAVLAATNSSVTTTTAATVYIQGAPNAGTNQSISNSYALWVDTGAVKFDASLTTDGAATFNGNVVIGNANTDTLTINAGTSGTGISFGDGSFANCSALETSGGVLTCGVDDNGASTVTIQDAYDNSTNPELVLDATRGGLTIQDNSSPLGTNLLEVQSNGGGATYFSVSASSASLTVDTTISGDLTVSAGNYISLAGGNTASRPGTPSEGMIYFDTDTDSLLVYANGKWQSDRGEYIVVASGHGTDPSTQAEQDSADYVTDGTADEIQINAALTAAAGGKVILLGGQYDADATILIPNNTTLQGVGPGTVITSNFGTGTDNLIENNDATGAAIIIRDLTLDGSEGTAGTQYGVYMQPIGNVSTPLQGVTITNTTVKGFISSGVFVQNVDNSLISENYFEDNGVAITTSNGESSIISDNNIVNSGTDGLYITSSVNFSITGNTIYNSGQDGIHALNVDYSTIANNTITTAATTGINVSSGSINNTISANTVRNSGGATDNNGIYLDASTTETIITGNNIVDDSCSTTCYAINIAAAGATDNYIADNTFDGGATINDVGTGTVYANQLDKDLDDTYANLQVSAPNRFVVNSSLLSVATSSANISGTADPDGTTTLAGSSTFFLSELQVGDRITVNAETRTVTAIASDTSLTVDTAFTNTAPATVNRLPASLIVQDSSNNVDFLVKDDGTVQISGLDCTANANGGVLTTDAFGNITCDDDNDSSGTVTLQAAYDNTSGEPEITVDGTRNGVTIRDNSTPIGVALFEVQNNAGDTDYFNVSVASTVVNNNLVVNTNSLFVDSTNSFVGIGTATPDAKLEVAGNLTANAWGTTGKALQIATGIYTDDSTAASGTATNAVINSFATPTLAATNASVTTTNAANVYIQGPPSAGTNQTITNAYALWVDAGATRLDGTLQVNGAATLASTLAVQGSSITVGEDSVTDGSIVFQNATNSFTVTLDAPAQTIGSAVFSFPDTGGVDDEICLLTEDNCAATAQNVFTTIDADNGTDPVADSSSDTLQVISGTGITVTGDSAADSLTIAAVLGDSVSLTTEVTGTLPIANGGTGGATQQDAANNLLGLTTEGDIIYRNAAGDAVRLARGTNGQCLTSNAATIIWGDCNSGVVQSFTDLDDTPNSYTAGSVLFTSATAVTEDNANFYWDDANNYLGLGTASPNARLTLGGNITANVWGVNGIVLNGQSGTFTDDSTAASGTATNATFYSFARPTLAATNSNVTTTNASTVYIANSPLAGTNQTITNAYSLWVDNGITRLDGTLNLSALNCTTNTNGGALTTDGSGNVTCSDDDGGGAAVTGTPNVGELAYFDSSSSIAGDADLFWDSGSGRLGVGINAPSTLVQIDGDLTIGDASNTTGSIIFENASNTNTATLRAGVSTANVIYEFDTTDTTGTYTICTTAGNCSGVGGGVTTPGGTSTYIPKFTAGQTLANSQIYDDTSKIVITNTDDAELWLEADTDNATESHNPLIRFRQDGGTEGLRIGLNGDTNGEFTDAIADAAYLMLSNSAPLQFASSTNGHLITIENDGDVGIGTATPAYQLQAVGPIASGDANTVGQIVLFDSDAGASTVTIQAGAFGSNMTFTWPTTTGTTGDCIKTNGTGTLSFGACGTGVGSSYTQGSVIFANSSNSLTEDNSNFYFNDSNDFFGIGLGSATAARLHVSDGGTFNAWGSNGIAIRADGATWTDGNTAGSGTASTAVFYSFGQPTLAASNSSVTTTDAASLYVAGEPTAGTNQTITNAYSIWVGSGSIKVDDSNPFVIDPGDAEGDLITIVAPTSISGNQSFTFPTAGGTLCTTTGNCSGVGGTGDVLLNGNSEASGMTLGNNANAAFNLETNGANRIQIGANGDVDFLHSTATTTALEVFDANSTTITLLVVDSTNDRVYIGDTTADATGTLLVLDSKNTAGDPTGVNGAMYYNSNTDKFRCYESGSWANCSDPDTVDVSFAPDYPNTVQQVGTGTPLVLEGNDQSGTAGTGSYVEHNYYDVEGNNSSISTNSFILSYRLPDNFNSFITDSFKIWTYSIDNTYTESYIHAEMRDVQGNVCIDMTSSSNNILPSTNSTWEQQTLDNPGGGCTLTAGDLVIMEFELGAKNNKNVRIGEFEFKYDT